MTAQRSTREKQEETKLYRDGTSRSAVIQVSCHPFTFPEIHVIKVYRTDTDESITVIEADDIMQVSV